jgi:hypothetical protein
MKRIFHKFILVVIFLIPFTIVAQEAMVKAEKDKAPATSRAQRKKAKKKWKENRKSELGQKKAVKEHHKRLQTKETRKRMKREKRKSERLRAGKKESFFEKMFRH